MIGIENSANDTTPVRSTAEVIDGRIAGIVTRASVWVEPAPDTRAASSSAGSRFWNAGCTMTYAIGINTIVYRKIIP